MNLEKKKEKKKPMQRSPVHLKFWGQEHPNGSEMHVSPTGQGFTTQKSTFLFVFVFVFVILLKENDFWFGYHNPNSVLGEEKKSTT